MENVKTLDNQVNHVFDQLKSKKGLPRQQRITLTDEQKERMMLQEPTEAQIAKLQRLKFSEDEILNFKTKYDAHEAIEQKIIEIEKWNAQPITEALAKTLITLGAEPDDVAKLTLGQGKQLMRLYYDKK